MTRLVADVTTRKRWWFPIAFCFAFPVMLFASDRAVSRIAEWLAKHGMIYDIKVRAED